MNFTMNASTFSYRSKYKEKQSILYIISCDNSKVLNIIIRSYILKKLLPIISYSQLLTNFINSKNVITVITFIVMICSSHLYWLGRLVLNMSVYRYHVPPTLRQITTYLKIQHDYYEVYWLLWFRLTFPDQRLSCRLCRMCTRFSRNSNRFDQVVPPPWSPIKLPLHQQSSHSQTLRLLLNIYILTNEKSIWMGHIYHLILCSVYCYVIRTWYHSWQLIIATFNLFKLWLKWSILYCIYTIKPLWQESFVVLQQILNLL